jgi:hypothetical protein
MILTWASKIERQYPPYILASVSFEGFRVSQLFNPLKSLDLLQGIQYALMAKLYPL